MFWLHISCIYCLNIHISNVPQKDYIDGFRTFFKVRCFAKFNDRRDYHPNVCAFHPQNGYLEYHLIIIILGDF